MCSVEGRGVKKCFEVKVSSCRTTEKERDKEPVELEREIASETEIGRGRECGHSWSYTVGCGLRKASVRATCVGGVSKTETHWAVRGQEHTSATTHKHRNIPALFHMLTLPPNPSLTRDTPPKPPH